MNPFRSPLAALFVGGSYTELLKQTVDSRTGEHDAIDTPLVVGALVFSGRQDEAIAAFRWWLRHHGDDATVRVACHFFLGVGECRSGRYDAAIGHCRDAVRARVRGEPLHGFFVHQSIGLLRHFTGRVASAARHAALARQFALESRFPYGRMLALDLLGHALVQENHVHAGIALLEQSGELAESLGLGANAGAPRTAIIAYRARYATPGFDPRGTLLERVAALGPEDAYSRRMVLSELAAQHAFYGEGEAAFQRVREAGMIPLPDGDRRAKIRQNVAEAIVLGFCRGADAAMEKLVAARERTAPGVDDALETEIVFAHALVAGVDAPTRAPEERAAITKLARVTGIGRVRVLAAPAGTRQSLDAITEDGIAWLLDAITTESEEARDRIVSLGLWGWLPKLFGYPPGRRIYLLHDRALLVVEDQGNVTPMEMPGAVLVTLLHAIAAGPVGKEELVRRVWRMKMYRAERHDPAVHTAASRLRNALGPAGAWIRIGDNGYALVEGVTIHDDRPHHADDQEAPSSPRDPVAAPAAAPAPQARGRQAVADRRAAVLKALGGEPSLSTTEIAQLLKISEMTAFRLLTAMVEDGAVERTGQGKRTRYSLRP